MEREEREEREDVKLVTSIDGILIGTGGEVEEERGARSIMGRPSVNCL